MQPLTPKGRSGTVTLPRDYLQRDGVLEDGEVPKGQHLVVDRLGRRCYLVRLTDGGEIPDPEQTEVVQRLAAQYLLDKGAIGSAQPAD